MAWVYEITTGKMYAPDGSVAGIGYSGGGTDSKNFLAVQCKNNPDCEDKSDMGPICEGWYTMLAPINSHVHGPYAIPLNPDASNQMYSRSEFMCHGDSLVEPGFASEGCIIQALVTRQKMGASADRRLQVVKVLPTKPLAMAA